MTKTKRRPANETATFNGSGGSTVEATIRYLLAPKVLSETVYRAGYVLRRELHDFGGGETELVSAYTPNGDYIGDARTARMLARRGIRPQKIDPSRNVCTIGYCERERKWYGWSHRAICGFGVGSVVKEGSVIAGAANFRIGFRASTLADAKSMAMVFADEVG